jgi:hypothetical protein
VTLLAQTSSEEARRVAHEILSERRFQPSPVPRPFQSLLHRLGDLAAPLIDAVRRAYHSLVDFLPGGRASVWVVLGGIVVLGAALFAARLGKRRARVLSERAALSAAEHSQDPASLDRSADEAERAGDLELALRLRFRSGLLRLGNARIIESRESITSRELSRRLHSPTFDRLAHDFDEVVYGRRSPKPDDVEIARAGWPKVLSEAGAR